MTKISILKHNKWFDKGYFHVAGKQYYFQLGSAVKTATMHTEMLKSGIGEKESLFWGLCASENQRSFGSYVGYDRWLTAESCIDRYVQSNTIIEPYEGWQLGAIRFGVVKSQIKILPEIKN